MQLSVLNTANEHEACGVLVAAPPAAVLFLHFDILDQGQGSTLSTLNNVADIPDQHVQGCELYKLQSKFGQGLAAVGRQLNTPSLSPFGCKMQLSAHAGGQLLCMHN